MLQIGNHLETILQLSNLDKTLRLDTCCKQFDF
jgi:hypothetical protein